MGVFIEYNKGWEQNYNALLKEKEECDSRIEELTENNYELGREAEERDGVEEENERLQFELKDALKQRGKGR